MNVWRNLSTYLANEKTFAVLLLTVRAIRRDKKGELLRLFEQSARLSKLLESVQAWFQIPTIVSGRLPSSRSAIRAPGAVVGADSDHCQLPIHALHSPPPPSTAAAEDRSMWWALRNQSVSDSTAPVLCHPFQFPPSATHSSAPPMTNQAQLQPTQTALPTAPLPRPSTVSPCEQTSLSSPTLTSNSGSASSETPPISGENISTDLEVSSAFLSFLMVSSKWDSWKKDSPLKRDLEIGICEMTGT